ncbi:MAG: GntR family transcriptional regulator [Bryobacterales bacterium]|nr:GntR family transcriptional regulator [Bryobacterales bacterium]
MPGIRTLAEELVVSHNTVAKAYTELEHQGLLVLRHGSGAYISVRRNIRSRTETVRWAQEQVRGFIASLREEGLADEEVRSLCEAALLYESPPIERASAGRKR